MTPKYDPKNYPKNYPTKWPFKKILPDSWTQSSRPCWNLKQISNKNISAHRRDNPSKKILRGRPESQLWRRHQNLSLWANQDDLTPTRFFYSGFITELQRFFCHIGNRSNRNGFGDMPFSIGFELRITWTLVWYGWNTCGEYWSLSLERWLHPLTRQPACTMFVQDGRPASIHHDRPDQPVKPGC